MRDRYLQSINRPQIYGTQFKGAAQNTMTQEPYDKSLIPDLIRDELGVPDLAAQQEQMKAFQTEKPGEPSPKEEPSQRARDSPHCSSQKMLRRCDAIGHPV